MRPPAQQESEIGSAFGPYILDRRLGEGGMATVWLARRRGPAGFERTVVIKRIMPALTHDPVMVKMFLSEARLAARLNHPNIVQVFELGEVEGEHYLAMEYVDGFDLATLMTLRGGAMPIGLCAHVMAEVSRALAHAHGVSIVHRDVSPSNILISREGAVKLGDFGIAKLLDDSFAERTRTGVIKGKISYMSAEQLQGRPIDHRADIHAAGVVLYEMLTGARLFKCGSDDDPLQMRARGPVPLCGRRADAPQRLENLCARALAFAASERLGSASEMAAELEQLQLDERWSAENLRALLCELPEAPLPLPEAATSGERPVHRPSQRGGWFAALREGRSRLLQRALLVAMLALVLAGGALWLRPAHRSDDLLEGLRRLRLDDARAALVFFERATAADASSAEAWMGRARAEARLGQRDQARTSADQAAAHVTANDRAARLAVEGLKAELDENWPLAAERYQARFSFYPDDVDNALALANAQMRGGHTQEALTTLQSLHVPGDARVPLMRANAADNLTAWQQSRDAADEAIRLARAQSAPSLVARGLIRRGHVTGMLGEFDRALADMAEARALLEELGDRMMLGRHYMHLVEVLRNKGDLIGAAAAAMQALAIDRESGDPSLIAASLQNAANVLSEQGDLQRAVGLYEESIGIMRRLGDRYRLASALISWGATLNDLGDSDGAERQLREAATLARQTQQDDLLSMALDSLGYVDFARGDLPQAEADWREEVTLAKKTGDVRAQVRGQSTLGLARFAAGDHAGARTLQQQTIKLAEELNDPLTVAGERAQLAIYLVHDKELAEAAPLLAETAEQFRAQKAEQQELRARGALARALAPARRSAALEEIQKARLLLARPLQVDSRAEALVFLAEAELALGDVRAARAFLDQAPQNGVSQLYRLQLRAIRSRMR